jgi:hypothetical protein
VIDNDGLDHVDVVVIDILMPEKTASHSLSNCANVHRICPSSPFQVAAEFPA